MTKNVMPGSREEKCEASLTTIMPGVTRREGKRGTSVRFSCMIGGKRFTKTCELPAELLIERGRPTKLLKDEFAKWQIEQQGSVGYSRGMGLRVPTIRELIETWEDMAWKRNANPDYRRPKERTIQTAIKNFNYCFEASRINDTRPYTDLTDVDMIRKLYQTFRDRGAKGISALSYVMALKTVTAKWTLIEYRDRGFDVRPTLIPDFGKATRAPTYHRLSKDQVAKIENWYVALMQSGSDRVKLGTTLIYNLAVRPNDCGALTRDNFPQEGEHHRLKYMPRKTNESSGRCVDIEIPDSLYKTIRDLAGSRWDSGETLIRSYRETFAIINASMRDCCNMPVGEWTKAAYELRKLCLDTVMRRQGIDQAIKLSGDRRETLEHYYVDPYKGTVPLMMVAPVGSAAIGK